MVKLSKSARTYTRAEIEIHLRKDGFSHEEATRVVTTLKRAEIPEGGIRFKDACEEFGISSGRLSEAAKRGLVTVLERRSWKFVILDRKSVEEYAALRRRFPRPGPRPRNEK